MTDTPQSTQHAEGSGIAQAQGPGAIATVITNIFRGGSAEQRAMRNRQAMLQLVHNFWVKGVLEQSLHGAAMIEFSLEERADAVECPWDMVLQTDREDRVLPPGTRIMDIFDEMTGGLLILGEPGSGKTTMLLELARGTIPRAEEDPMQPIPVVFNLSSWAEKRQSIAEWLVDEFSSKYNIPKKIARPWVEKDELLLLLDGLDEVAQKHREDCVRAIDRFRQEHLVPLAVCSRVADYEVLTTQLRLQSAVLLQPLTLQQVDEYLDGAGTELSVVREILRDDTTFQELAKSPLMLSTMTIAYRGASAEDLQSLDSVEARRRHVFSTYVQRMFERRRGDERYSPDQTIHWLSGLAQKMTLHAQTVFLIERMQPVWVSSRIWRWIYVLGSRLIGVLSVGLSVGLLLLVGRGVLTIALCGLCVGLIDVLRLEQSGKNVTARQAPAHLRSAINVLLVGLGVGLITSLMHLLMSGGIDRLFLSGWTGRLMDVVIDEGVLIAGLMLVGELMDILMDFSVMVAGLVFGLIFGLRGSRQSLTTDIQAVEALSWSWGSALRGGAWGLILGFAFGLGVELISFLEYVQILGLSTEVTGKLLVGARLALVSLGPISAVIGGLFGGLSSNIVETKMTSNQGIRLWLRNSVFTGLTIGLISWLICGLFAWPIVELTVDVVLAILYPGLILGSLSLLWYGGLDIIQHFILRFILYCTGLVPWNLARFLDYATDRIFLRKVGGGYIFVHRLLMEYFASLEDNHG